MHPTHAHRPPPDAGGPPAALVTLVQADALDPALAGLVWTLLEGGVPLVVAAPGEETAALRRRVLGGLVEVAARRRRLVGVLELEPSDGADAYAVAGDLESPPFDPATARAVAGAMSVIDQGLGLAFALDAASLEEVLAALGGSAVRSFQDRASYLGLVLILDDATPAHPLGRVRIAHYLRPLSRDAGGHLQRLPPAVLAARDARSGRLEDFSWGVVPELAARVGRPAAELELEVAERTSLLRASAAIGHQLAGDAAG